MDNQKRRWSIGADQSKLVFQIVFIGGVVLSFLLWLTGIFKNGSASSQFQIFFAQCGDFFADSTNVTGYSSQLDPYHNLFYTGLQEKAYPPLTYFIMYFFSKLVGDLDSFVNGTLELRNLYQDPKWLIIYLIFATAVMIAVYELIHTLTQGNRMIKIMTAAAVCLSAPILFSYERANTIILTMFCCMFFIFYHDSENKVLRELALIALAVATAFKMTPAILGILLLYKKQWFESVRVVIYGIIIGIGPFLLLKGGLSNLPQMFANMQLNVAAYTETEGCTLIAAATSFGMTPTAQLSTIFRVTTMVICLVLFVSGLFYRNRWETVMAVSMVLIIFPSHSGQYCILYLVPAIIAFLNAKEHAPADWIILFAILCIMQDFQSAITIYYFNYHLAILLITAVLSVRGIIQIVCTFRTNGIKLQNKMQNA